MIAAARNPGQEIGVNVNLFSIRIIDLDLGSGICLGEVRVPRVGGSSRNSGTG